MIVKRITDAILKYIYICIVLICEYTMEKQVFIRKMCTANPVDIWFEVFVTVTDGRDETYGPSTRHPLPALAGSDN